MEPYFSYQYQLTIISCSESTRGKGAGGREQGAGSREQGAGSRGKELVHFPPASSGQSILDFAFVATKQLGKKKRDKPATAD
jgi:hypothetical protein